MTPRTPDWFLKFWLLVFGAAMASCGGEAEEITSDVTSSTTVSPSATASPATPSATPQATDGPVPAGLSDFGLVFVRGDTDPDYPTAGAIWVSDGDGSNARQVTPAGVAVSYVGLGQSNSGARPLYYVTQDANGNTTIYSTDLDTGETVPLLSYQDTPGYFFADVRPNGRHVVHTQPLGLDMYDLATGSNTTLFQSGSGTDCLANVLAQCYRAIDPDWSPDGRLLKVVHSVYEGGWVEVVDPFQSPVAVFTAGDRSYPHNGRWSPASDALCAQGIGLAELSGLYLLESPDWEAQNLFPEFEDWTINPDSRQVVACDWISPTEVAFIAMVNRPERHGETHVFDMSTGHSTFIANMPDANSCCSGQIVTLPGVRIAVTQSLVDEGNINAPHYVSSFVWSRPAIIDFATGNASHVLEKGDIILAAFAR